MKRNAIKKVKIFGVLGILFAVVFATRAFAMSPTLSITGYGSTVQMTVYGDPNSSIILDYQSPYGGVLGAGIVGYTNQSGYFSYSLNTSLYSIPTGAQVFVLVDGQQSQFVAWPTTTYGYNGYGYQSNYPYIYANQQLSLSTTTVQLIAGQAQQVQIYGANASGYYISNNSNASVVSPTISGNALSLYGIGAGTSTLTVCSNNYYGGITSGCATLWVTVTIPYQYYNSYNTYPYNYTNNSYYSYPYTQQYQYQNQYQTPCYGRH